MAAASSPPNTLGFLNALRFGGLSGSFVSSGWTSASNSSSYINDSFDIVLLSTFRAGAGSCALSSRLVGGMRGVAYKFDAVQRVRIQRVATFGFDFGDDRLRHRIAGDKRGPVVAKPREQLLAGIVDE